MIAKCLSCGYAIDTVNDGKICKLFGNPCSDTIACQSSDEFRPKQQTNADRIRQMTDEELAEFISGKARTFGEEYEGYMSALDWLKEDGEL